MKMIKLNLKKMVGENHKGIKEDRRMLSADGYYLNGFFGVKVGIDKALDRMFDGVQVQEGLFLEKIVKKCEYDVVKIEEKAIITKIDGRLVVAVGTEGYTKRIEGTIYLNSEYYRFIKKHNLEIKIHPESGAVAGFKNGEKVAIFLGIRYGGTDTLAREMWQKEQTVEEYVALKEKEKAEKEQAKKKLEEFANKTARELLVDLKINSQVMDIILNQGEGCRMTKSDKKTYVLECKVEGKWCAFQRLDRKTNKLSEQKLIGMKMLEILNSNLQEFISEVEDEIKEKELIKSNFDKDLEELEEIEKELVEFGVVHPAFKMGVYGDYEKGFRLEIQGLGHFLRLKTGYTLENVNNSMNGTKDLMEGSREELIQKIKTTIAPDVQEHLIYTKKVELVKELFNSNKELLEKREDGYRIIDLTTSSLYTINRGRVNHYRSLGRDCLLEYIVDKAKEVCTINLMQDGLTKKELDKKQMINLEEYFKNNINEEYYKITEEPTEESEEIVNEFMELVVEHSQGYISNDDMLVRLESMLECKNLLDTTIGAIENIKNKISTNKEIEKFKKHKLEQYFVKETGNLCIDTGSMLYKKIDGVATKTRVDTFLDEYREYEIKLFNNKYIDIPHYIIYRKGEKKNE